ncbi:MULTISPECIES: AraC family transcriptional regulator [unclassified Paenibacillus]|uniref:AraC family transcriptional regulator n=1 Tax=unclassified Paenibacillus TaxID=185978 RepID=UPI0027866275|nr:MULTISPECIES: AraC family transcriptional regulator [unclassified Paenibacillus]MDQ0902092.1 AraC family transcriptional regulator of arabinose operon [Paenibacillus sp. V4I7]MDQ0919414.1 AraC family transcriptional regulator of arabinose operon [Paenibacillus sp. V4I5]
MEVTSHLDLNGNFGKVTCERTWKWDTRHQPLEDFDLWYAWSGTGTMLRNKKTYSVEGGTCFLFRPGDRTAASHDPQQPLTVTYIHFSLPASEQIMQRIPSGFHFVKDRFVFETYLNRYVETMMENTRDSALEGKLLLTLMLMQLKREEEQPAAHPADHLSAMIRMLAYRIRQTPGIPYSLGSLAENANLSPRYFSLKFKEIMGISLEQFLIQTRIERAEHLLRFNGMNASEVAEALGYRDLSFFSRQFKKIRGKNPSDIRKEGARR